MSKAREYSAELRRYGSAIRSRRGIAHQGSSPDGSDLFARSPFVATLRMPGPGQAFSVDS